MIWHYFPIGLRFPVKDFSDDTKRMCWETALSALCASGAAGATLYDAQETYDYGSGGPVYTCIACIEGIKQSRLIGKALYDLDALTARLCLHRPFVQANYLESFGPYPILGKETENGAAEITESGAPFLPEQVAPMRKPSGMKILIAADGIGAELPAETVTRALGAAAAAHGLRVRRMALACGTAGTVRALVTATNARYEMLNCTTADGQRFSETIGVLPGCEAVTESAGLPDALLTRLFEYGYRTVLVGEDAYAAARERIAEEPLLNNTVYRSLSASDGPERVGVFDRIGFDAAAKQSDFVVLFASGTTYAAETALDRLNALNKPVCLITMQEDGGDDRLMRAYPVLRAVIPCAACGGQTEAVLAERMQREIVQILGKDVANAVNI